MGFFGVRTALGSHTTPEHSSKDVEVPAAPTTTSSSPNDARDELKDKLRSLLSKYNGCTKHVEVRDAIYRLAAVNPCSENCSSSELFVGEYRTLTAPTFPGRISPSQGLEDIVQYTLGRLSFNIFQPTKLVCTLRSIHNPIRPKASTTADGRKTFTYHFVLDITIHTPDGHDLPATMVNEAYCYASSDVNNRLAATFTGATLMPAEEIVDDPSKLKLWAETFEGAYQKADEERSYFGWFFHVLVNFMLGLTLTLPSSSDKQNEVFKNSFHFDMKRAPTGHFDVLYLDDDIRITKGNRGTLVVVERSPMTDRAHHTIG